MLAKGLVGAVAMLSLIAPAKSAVSHARSIPGYDDLKLYAVNIFRTPRQSWPGYGVYLGRGLVLTAAHVVGHSFFANPTVLIGGKRLEARVVKEGEFDKIDLTLLSVDQTQLPAHVGLRLMPICKDPPYVGEPVVVAIPDVVAPSTIMSPQSLPADMRARFNTVIADVASTGNSGSGIFDARTQCLIGIMSRKIQRPFTVSKDGVPVEVLYDVAKYFVPAEEIRQFLARSK